jgi:hypothetical protein
MPEPFQLTDDERCFLSHWMYDAMGPFWGPSVIWCCNNRINWSHAPYPMAMIFSREEIDAGREGWFFDRPPVPFRVPWRDHDEFWRRASACVSDIRIQGIGLYLPSSPLVNLKGSLTPEESNYLRAYNQEMVRSGSGHYIDLAHQHGVLSFHLIPFFVLLKDLYRPPTTPVIYPWPDFPSRYEELSGRKYEYPDWALTAR